MFVLMLHVYLINWPKSLAVCHYDCSDELLCSVLYVDVAYVATLLVYAFVMLFCLINIVFDQDFTV